MIHAGAVSLDITPPLGTKLRGTFHEHRKRIATARARP
jgi:hypothetical protein